MHEVHHGGGSQIRKCLKQPSKKQRALNICKAHLLLTLSRSLTWIIIVLTTVASGGSFTLVNLMQALAHRHAERLT